MKKTFVVLILPWALLCAADQKTATKKPAPKATALSIPAGATEVEPYLYRYQDSDGQKWLYRQTPFGVVRLEDKPLAAPVADSNPVVVTDLGETVKFETNTPFGLRSWTRKKTELSEGDRALLQDSVKGATTSGEAASKKQAGGRNTEKQ